MHHTRGRLRGPLSLAWASRGTSPVASFSSAHTQATRKDYCWAHKARVLGASAIPSLAHTPGNSKSQAPGQGSSHLRGPPGTPETACWAEGSPQPNNVWHPLPTGTWLLPPLPWLAKNRLQGHKLQPHIQRGTPTSVLEMQGAQRCPGAQPHTCLTEAPGLQFKSFFMDSYKGESELLTCLHSAKSIRINETTAELPLPMVAQQNWAMAPLPQLYRAANPHGFSLPTGPGTRPPGHRPSVQWAICGHQASGRSLPQPD